MSDQSPPPKPKPGSLRDRIAAFENKGTSPSTSGPPPPRPKPGGLQWKPRPPSPSTSPDSVQSGEQKSPSTGGMSASDAMESIGRGGSLKERMAALQGKGAFGGPPPPIAPKPSVERPKWKPPPAVPAPAASESEPRESIEASAREASRSPPPRAAGSPTPESQATSNREGDAVVQEGNSGDLDAEEGERQRRAAIAARMARLGGARFGMGPPIFAPKPVARKADPAAAVKEETHGDQPLVVKESNEAPVTPPHDLPVASPPVHEAVTETEPKDELESSPPVPTRTQASMPMPVGPRRAAPPRKKSSKNAPTTVLPEPPAEGADSVAVQPPPIANEPPASADPAIHDAARDSEEVVATQDEHLNAPRADPSQTAPAEGFRKPVEEPEQQKAEEELVAASHIEEESSVSATDNQEVPSEEPPQAVGAEEDEEEEEARRRRVAAKLTQMGAFNPLAGPPPVPARQLSFDEPAPTPSKASLNVEDEVNVDTEEYGETIPSPPIVSPRHEAMQSIKCDPAAPHVAADQVDADERVAANRDGEHTIVSYTEEQGGGHDGPTIPSPKLSEDPLVARDSVRAAEGTASMEGEAQLGANVQDRLHADVVTNDSVARSTIAEHDTTKAEKEAEALPPPRVTRPIPPPPPVNLQSKPTPPSSPLLSPPPRTPLQSLRVEEEERQCPPSPDIPPRPIPPPGRSGSMTEDVPSPPPRWSMPPPPRRTSVRVTEALASPPSSPPPVPTSPRPVSRRPDTPPIITTLTVPERAAPAEHEKEHVAEEDPAENVTPRPEGPEDEESIRRRAIAERMARLGGIRFGAPPPMNPLSRPPLPAAPPPTSIPPDEPEEEEIKGPRGEEEDEAARKQRIAAKLAGMGGMRLGMLPPSAGLPPRRVVGRQEDSENEDVILPVPVPAPPQRAPPVRKPPPPIEEPVEQEPSEQAGSRGTSDDGVRVEAEESDMEEVRYSDAEVPVVSEEESAPAMPPPRSTQTVTGALPTPPPRMASRSPPPNRPPIPTIPALLGRRPSTTSGSMSVSSSRHASLDEPGPGETPTMSGSIFRPQSEYVMVEAEDEDDVPATPPPRRKSARGASRTVPALPPVPPPSAIDPPEALSGSAQWELASIPQGPEFGEGSEMVSSGWSEDSTAVHAPAALSASSHAGSRSGSGKFVSSSSVSGSAIGTGSGSTSGLGSGSGRRSVDQHPPQPQLTTDELTALGSKTAGRVVEAATALFEKSKRALVGDGSHAGFVRAVLAQVPGAVYHGSADDDGWGYVVYAQTGGAVQRRVSDILPGDVIAFWDAKLKGHKGLQPYTQTAGAGAEGGGRPLVGIVHALDGRKSKVRVWQANQHVGQQNGALTPRATQTVEIVSYRLDDLKSGQVKVYRVLEA